MIKKTRFKQSVKTQKIDDKFKIHSLARRPYQIFCECIGSDFMSQDTKIKTKMPLVEVIKVHDHYLFFDDFRLICSFTDGSSVSIRRMDMSNAEIERRAWHYLLNILLESEPLNLELLHSIRNTMPDTVQKYLFDGALTVQHILNQRNIPRYKYDYRLRNIGTLVPHQLPSFSDLIREVHNDTE